MGHELTNLFILAGSLFLLFIGYLAYQLASTETETKPISNEQYMLIVPKGTITGSDELVFE